MSGKTAFELHQSYGLPIDLILEITLDEDILVDLRKYKEEEYKHKMISRASSEKKFGGHGIT